MADRDDAEPGLANHVTVHVTPTYKVERATSRPDPLAPSRFLLLSLLFLPIASGLASTRRDPDRIRGRRRRRPPSVLPSPPPAPVDTVKPPSPPPRPRRRSRSGGAGRGLAAGADLGVGGVDPGRFGPGLRWAARPAPARAITGKFYSAVGLSSGSVEDINFCEMLTSVSPPVLRSSDS